MGIDALSVVAPFKIVLPRGRSPIRMRPPTRLDSDELAAFCADNPSMRIEQTAEGELIIMPPTGGRTGNRNVALSTQLHLWVKQASTGVDFDSSTGFQLPNGATRSPDASWLKRERWDALSTEQQDRFVPLCPDFVVEIRSPSDNLDVLKAKLEEYMDCGSMLGWLIDPVEGRAYVYRPDREVEELDAPTELCGDPELPGFALDLTEIW